MKILLSQIIHNQIKIGKFGKLTKAF